MLMDTTITKNKKIACLSVIIVCSLLWLGYQVLLWNSDTQFLVYSRKAVALLGIPAMNRDLEWRRFCSVLAYLQTLPHVLLAYCLFQKWPGKKNAVRVLLVLLVFACSLIAIPRISGRLFPSYRNILSSNNPNYPRVLLIHGLVGLCATAAAFLGDSATTLLPQNRPAVLSKAVKTRAIQYGLTLVVSFLVAVCYGWVLSVLGHFSPSAVKHVINAFSPDSRLIAGIITMCFMAPLMEEMAFRGLILNKVKKYSTIWVGVIFSSLLFGLWHRNLGQFIATFAMGIIFSWVYLKTGKLRFAMLCHSASNLILALALVGSTGYLPKITPLIKMRTLLLEASLPVAIIGLLLVAGLTGLLIAKGYPRRPEENV